MQVYPVHSGQQDGHHVQLRHPRGRQRLHREPERVSGHTTEGAVQREAESGFRVTPPSPPTDSQAAKMHAAWLAVIRNNMATTLALVSLPETIEKLPDEEPFNASEFLGLF